MEDGNETRFDLHAERITISDDRYLIYYTFSPASDEAESEKETNGPEE